MALAAGNPRQPAAVALGLCLLAVLAAVLWSRLSHRTEVAAPGAVRVADAMVAEAGPDYPAAPPATTTTPAGRQVALPDNWDGTRPDFTGHVWYRIDLPEPASRWARPVIYLPAAGMNAEVWFDGRRIGGAGRMWPRVTRHFYTPQLVDLPPGLDGRSGRVDSLWVLVSGHPGYRCGLAPVWLGEHEVLYGAWRWRAFWQNDGTGVTIVINLAIAVLVTLLWWRDRSHAAYGWFGAAAAVWGLRNLNYVVVEPPIPDLLFAELCVSGAAWFTALFAIFSLRFAQAHHAGYRGPRGFVPAALGYALMSTVFFLSADSYARANAGFAALAAVGVGLTLFSMWRLVRLALVNPRADLVAVAAGAVVYLVLLINDYAIGVDHASLGEVFIRQYASLPLFGAITATLVQRYLAALRASRELAESLRSQVEAQRQQLANSFERLRDAEREQARAQERGRLMGDLHDGLGLHLATALRLARAEQASREQLMLALQDCMDDLRVAVDSLDEQERDPLALLGSLRFRMAPRFESAGLRLGWQVAPELADLPVLDASGALDLLRIVQEALGNVLKHSGATVVGMSLATSPEGTLVAVTDNGRGFDPALAASGRGMGTMQTRALRLGARLRWTRLEQGMTMELLLPGHATSG